MHRRPLRHIALLLVAGLLYSQNLYAVGPAVSYPINPAFNALCQSRLPLEIKQVTTISYTNKGTSLGIDPRIASAVGAPILGAIGQGFQAGNLFGQGMVSVVNESIKAGFVAVGTQFLMDKLPDNLGASFLGGVLSSSFNKLINPTGPINIVDAFMGSFKDLGQKLLDPVSLNNLTQAINTNGLKVGLETYAQDIFERSTIESMVSIGGTISNFVGSRLAFASEAIFSGQQAKKLDLSTSQADLKVYYKETPDGLKFLGYEENDGFVELTDSQPKLLSADISKYYDGDKTLTRVVENGKTTKWEIRDSATQELLIDVVDNSMDLVSIPDPVGRITNYLLDGTLEFFGDGTASLKLATDGQPLDPKAFNGLSAGSKQNITRAMLSAPGVSDEIGDNIPLYLQQHKELLESKLRASGLSDVVVSNLSFFRGTKGKDMNDLFKNEFFGGLNNEMRTELDKFYTTYNYKKGDPIYPMFYSGSVEPGLKALEMGQDNAPIVFAIGGYNSHEKTIQNNSIKLFVNIAGDQDGVSSPKSYGGLDTLNVILVGGVLHTDYFTSNKYENLIADARVQAALGADKVKSFFVNSSHVVKVEGNKVYIDLSKEAND